MPPARHPPLVPSLLLALLAGAPAATAAPAAPAAFTSPAARTSAPAAARLVRTDRGPCREVGFEIASNKIWLPVRVNGSAPQWFILDTGDQGRSVLARECAVRLGLATAEGRTASLGAGEGVQVHVSSLPGVRLAVAGAEFRPPQVRVFELGHVSPFEGRRVDGLLGEDFLHAHVVEIDYASRTLRLYDPARYRYAGRARPVPMLNPEGLVVVRARVTPPGRPPIDCRVVLDTGVRSTVIWYHPFVEAQDLPRAFPRTFAATIGGGAGGETRGDVCRLARLTIGDLAFAQPTAVLSRDTSGVFASSDEDGIVGGELLRRCRVTFDYPHGRVILEPYRAPVTGFDYDMSGLFLVAGGDAFERVTVLSVAEGSPAADAGLVRGDEILALDGAPAATLTLDAVRARLARRGARVTLRVRHGADEKDVALVLRPLV